MVLAPRDLAGCEHRLALDFAPGLNVLTGETGAGKSILLDCLGFVLGWRGRAELVRAGAHHVERETFEAALAMGASRTQTVFSHVLPLAMPGVMTGAIISMAHALGETAPLLLIVVVLVFGTKRLTSGAKDLGSAVKEFKKGMRDDDKPNAQLGDESRSQDASRTAQDEHDRTPR